MPAPLPLGNDIVDLGTAHNRASVANPRFVKRVLAPQEYATLMSAPHHNETFWAYWAAKEAAYKALKKTNPNLVFSHRRFVVTVSEPSPFNAGCGTARGTVEYAGQTLTVVWNWTACWIHCVTGSATNPQRIKVGALSELRSQPAFMELKQAGSLSDQSVSVRLLAMSLLRGHGIHDAQIVRPHIKHRPGPPRVLHNSALLPNVEVSLSHDGAYAAAAVRVQ